MRINERLEWKMDEGTAEDEVERFMTASSQSWGGSLEWFPLSIIANHSPTHAVSIPVGTCQTNSYTGSGASRSAKLCAVYWQPSLRGGVRACGKMWCVQVSFHYWKSVWMDMCTVNSLVRLLVSNNNSKPGVTIYSGLFVSMFLSWSFLPPKIEIKNKNGTNRMGWMMCVWCVCWGERLTEKDMVFVTVGIVSKHMYIHAQKLISKFCQPIR